MLEFIEKEGFSCDRQSKYDFTASTINYIIQTTENKDIEIVFKEFDENGKLIPFDSDKSSTTSDSDLVMFYNNHPYLIELKERKGIYTSEFYGKEGDKEGWMLNIKKEKDLQNQKWAIPLYVNLFPDGIIRLWNLNKIKINKDKKLEKNINEYTVAVSEKKKQKRYEVWNKDSKVIQRVKGHPSNGIWTSQGTN